MFTIVISNNTKYNVSVTRLYNTKEDAFLPMLAEMNAILKNVAGSVITPDVDFPMKDKCIDDKELNRCTVSFTEDGFSICDTDDCWYGRVEEVPESKGICMAKTADGVPVGLNDTVYVIAKTSKPNKNGRLHKTKDLDIFEASIMELRFHEGYPYADGVIWWDGYAVAKTPADDTKPFAFSENFDIGKENVFVDKAAALKELERFKKNGYHEMSGFGNYIMAQEDWDKLKAAQTR